jgi:hypothetical protein
MTLEKRNGPVSKVAGPGGRPGAHTFDLVVGQLPTIARFLAGGW